MVTLQEIEKWAFEFSDVVKLPHFEKTSFRIKKKIFATLDVQAKRLVVKFSEIDQSVFCSYDSKIIYPVSGGWGKRGYTIIELTKVKKTLCRDALRTSYETVLKPKVKQKAKPKN